MEGQMGKVYVELDLEYDIDLLFQILGRYTDEEEELLEEGTPEAKAEAKKVHEAGKRLLYQMRSGRALPFGKPLPRAARR
jgi:hypothetical protein